jgi:hypothetical protein
MSEHAQLLQVGEIVADGGWSCPETEALAEILGPYGSPGGYVLLDDGSKHPFLS